MKTKGRRPIIGYVVLGAHGGLQLSSRYPGAAKNPVLTHGGSADLFPTRAAAKRATVRTELYGMERGYNKVAWGGHRILAVREVSS